MHVDTGHNFQEVIDYRDERVDTLGLQLVVASVQEAIDKGRVPDPGPLGMRNRLQTTALLDAINANKFDAAFGVFEGLGTAADWPEKTLAWRKRREGSRLVWEADVTPALLAGTIGSRHKGFVKMQERSAKRQ